VKRFEAADENRRQRSAVILPIYRERQSGSDLPNGMEAVMTKHLRRWRSCRRYRTTLRALSSLTVGQLSELGIRPMEIHHLAREAARVA
jgi:uncharacterized protein YjiS (DUF1127 family)